METWQVIVGIVGGFVVLWRAGPVIWRAWKAFGRIPEITEATISVANLEPQLHRLADIADSVLAEFAPNGGSSMRDQVDAIVAWQDSHRAEEAARLSQLQQVASDLAETNTYAHQNVHQLRDTVTPFVGWMPVVDRRLEAIEATLAAQDAREAEGEEGQ